MKKSILTAVILLTTLAGCAASHNGPPARAVKLAYAENVMGNFNKQVVLHSAWKKVFPRMRVTHCKKDSAPGQWSCEVYVQDANGPHDAATIRMIQEGSVWKAYEGE